MNFNFSLAAISTLYFVEHSQINQFAYNGAAFRSLTRESSLSNAGNGGGSGSGGNGMINGFDPITWRHPNNRKSSGDYPTFTQSHHAEKKTPFSKSILYNNFTSNYSRAAFTPIASSSQRTLPQNDTLDANGIAATTKTIDDDVKRQLTVSDDINKVYEYEESPQTNSNSSNYVKKVKVTHSVDVLQNVPNLMESQKSETNAEMIVTIGSEPQQDLNWTNNVITDNSYLLTDVDTNLIDVGQRTPGNGSKLESKTLIKNRSSTESDLINLPTIREYFHCFLVFPTIYIDDYREHIPFQMT